MFFQRIKSIAFLTIILIFTLLNASPAYSLDPDSKQPIQIESDRATLNDETGISNYAGNVIISQGHIRLEADNISVNSINREITSIKANGKPAHFVQQTDSNDLYTHGYGSTIIYVASEGILKFIGQAKLVQNNNSFSGDQIEYDIDKKAIKAKGDESVGSRVKIQYQQPKKLSIPPSSDDTKSTTLIPNLKSTHVTPKIEPSLPTLNKNPTNLNQPTPNLNKPLPKSSSPNENP